jgi:hypothetical protein
MDQNEGKNLVVKAGLELVRSGLIARTWGNVSCRIDGETFAITPSGREYHSLTADDIVTVKIKDLSYEGSIKPSSEKGIHAAVYQLYPDMNFVIHTHQENASSNIDGYTWTFEGEVPDSLIHPQYGEVWNITMGSLAHEHQQHKGSKYGLISNCRCSIEPKFALKDLLEKVKKLKQEIINAQNGETTA